MNHVLDLKGVNKEASLVYTEGCREYNRCTDVPISNRLVKILINISYD